MTFPEPPPSEPPVPRPGRFLSISVADVTKVNSILEANGYGPDNFKGEMIDGRDADETPTKYYGAHFWGMSDGDWTTLLALLRGTGAVEVVNDTEKEADKHHMSRVLAEHNIKFKTRE